MKPDWRSSRSPKKKQLLVLDCHRGRTQVTVVNNCSRKPKTPAKLSHRTGEASEALMSPVPSRPWQWEGCRPAWQRLRTPPLYICRTDTHLPICPRQLGNREQFVSGDSRCQEVPLAAQVLSWVSLQGGKPMMSQGREAHADKTVSTVRAGPPPSLGSLWSHTVGRRRFKMYGHETAGSRCQLLATYKSTFAH